MNYVCLFKVLYWNDAVGANVEECGFCLAESFTQVTEYLEKHLYGDDLMEIRHIELFDTCPTVSPETWEKMKKDLEEL